MPFNKKINQDFYLKNNRIVLSPEYLKNNISRFKKITGTRLASVISKNKYTSPVKIWTLMVNIYSEAIDPMYGIIGNLIEPKIHKWVCEKTNINFKQYNPFEIKWDVFKDNKIFGGIPDGEPIDTNGNLLYPSKPMLEIKTTSIDSFKFKKEGNLFVLQKDANNHPIIKKIGEKQEKWFDLNNDIIIPDEYKYQLGLYCYLRNISNGLFAICFLETKDYIEPKEVNINDRRIELVEFKVDLEEFKNIIEYATDWYKDFIENGSSPELSAEDLKWFNDEING